MSNNNEEKKDYGVKGNSERLPRLLRRIIIMKQSKRNDSGADEG